ncbi:glycosyl hydrolase [Paenibacillus dendrobii]|nr:glycosyl hydrolase [Paenibacillus dendrobii]
MITGIFLIGVTGFWLYGRDRQSEVSPIKTEAFIQKFMVNPNGTLATYLQSGSSANPEIAAGREALSESMGFWMQYALLKQDQGLFEQSYEALKRYFLTPQHYLAWKLAPDGTTNVHTNALGDDLRIIGALLKAEQLWGTAENRGLAEELTGTLVTSATVKGYWTDFHDFSRNESAQVLSLAYIDSDALNQLRQAQLIEPAFYNRHIRLLENMPNDGAFYPKSFDVMNRQYAYDDSVNLIDQLLVGLHAAEIGRRPEPLMDFLKKEWGHSHKLFGRYDRSSRESSVDYESPSVYGLAVQLALRVGDQDWAGELYKHMLSLHDGERQYNGGYVFNGNTHIFDNLLPLLATQLWNDRA